MTRNNAHVCPRTGCKNQVAPNKLMCPGCWRLVPHDIQQAVYAAWNYGQGAGSAEHYHAMEAAITAVNERQPTDG